MKQKLIIFVVLILFGVILIGLNAASYTQKEQTPDSELFPNRSTFNSGATGTQAFYTLLAETGRRPVQWREPPAALITAGDNAPSVFVITGDVRRSFTEPEVNDLLRWVSTGRRLVVIDREPAKGLMTTSATWRIDVASPLNPDIYTVDASDQKQMTGSTAATKPVQPTLFTQNVNAVQASKFAASVAFERLVDEYEEFDDESPPPSRIDPPPVTGGERQPKGFDRQIDDGIDRLPGAPSIELPMATSVESPSQVGPVVHFGSTGSNLVVGVPYGEGEIVYLADPFVVSNSGIHLVDNAQLAINLVSTNGTVAFDEYHQGYGVDSNRFLQFFAGTPVVAIFFQAVVLVGSVFFSRSRRFARPIPESEPDRLSKLEYVAAMSDLQERTKAYDLAVENIYAEFRRRLSRQFGLDNFHVRFDDLAIRVAERTGLDKAHLAEIFHRCEEVTRGEPTSRKETLRLTSELRTIERELGLSRSGRARN